VDGVAYASLTNAIDAAGAVATGDAVVSLRGDVNLGDEGLTIDGAYAFVLDLNGKIITSDQTSGEVLTVQSELTVIDSVGGGAISNLVADTLVYLNGGFLTVGYVNGDNGATFYGQIGREAEETISIVRGKFSSAPEAGYIADGSYQKEEPEDNLYVVEPGTPVNNVAEVNGQGYETLADAVAAAGSSDTVTLLADITLDDWILVEKAFALDLNGHTLSKGENWTTVTPAHDAIVAIKHGGSLTINDTVGTGVIDGTDLAVGVKMTVAYDTDDTYPAVLVVNAGTIKGENYGISGNGLPGRGNTAVTINGGTILGVDPTGDSCGIFNPQAGTLTIAGGHIEGGQGIWIKSGTCTCTVNAGTIVGTAPKAAYKTSTNGFNSTGDAFVVDNVGYVGGAPVPSIAGGTFVSSNSTAVASYADSKNSPIESFVSGGTFNTAVETEYCATGFIPADNGNGTYGVEAGWKIAFVNDDDTLIYATNVQANATVEYLGETPTKAADAEYTYEFTGWTPAIVSPAVADATYTATFSATPIAPAAPVVDGNPVDTDKVFEEAASNKPIVYPTAPTVTTDSETGSQTITYGGQTVDVPAYYTATLEGTTVTLELNEKAVPAIEEATISEETKPAMEVTGSTTAVTLGTTSTKLYYGLVSADAPDSDDLNPASAGFTVPTLTQGTGNAMQISIPVDSNETSKFYKVYVTDIAPASGN